jgi:DNA-binding GntR family transcriptional regulator
MASPQNSPLTELAYNKIKNDILSCALEPGAQISLSYLSEKYKIGRSPINNALQKLMHESLVLSIPRVGYFISLITIGDMKQIFETMQIIQVNINALAAKNASEDDLNQIVAMSDFSYVYKDPISYSMFLEKNKEFHIKIASATGNTRLVEILAKVMDEFTRILYLGLDLKDSGEEMHIEHLDLAIALRDRNIDRVKELSKKQIVRSQERVMDALFQKALDHSEVSVQDLIRLKKDKIGIDNILTLRG